MSKKLRVLSLVLVLLFLLPLFPSKVSSTGILPGPIDTSEDAILKGTLEDAAEEYVTKFINTAYLYKVEDFSEGTLIEQQTRNSAAMPAQINLASGSYTTAELCENIQFFADLAGYYRYVRMANQVVRQNFKLTISDFETTISGDTATVKMYTLVAFRYPHLEDDSAFGEYYTVSFVKMDDEWIVADVRSEEMEMLGMSKNTFDIQEEIAVFDEQKAEKDRMGPSVVEESIEFDTQDAEIRNAGTVINTRGYNQTSAVAYAHTYTTTTYTGDHNNSAFINPLFGDWDDEGGNCMNFASQCIWAGLYGSNSASAIQTVQAPMDNTGSSADQWYYKASHSPDPNHNWLVTNNFWNYAKRCVGRTGEGIVMECFTANNLNGLRNSTPTSGNATLIVSEMSGAVLLVRNVGHAIVCVNASFDEIIFCGNSPMRRIATNEDFPNYFSGQICIIVPKQYRSVSTCSGHVYETGSSSDGLSAKCLNCGYLDLRITPYLRQPVPTGTTLDIIGLVNRPCYRTAIAISYNGGTASWTTYMNVSISFSRTYTFSRAGLYTITLSVRDTNDETHSDSENVSYVYTLRVY